MNIKTLWWITCCVVFLTACGGGVFDRAYIAGGDGSRESELTADEQFTPTEDFNVVVKLNKHDETVKITARFIDINKDVVQEVSASAPSTVGTVVLGLDYQARADTGNEWLRGRYTVEILIDGEVVETLYFTVG